MDETEGREHVALSNATEDARQLLGHAHDLISNMTLLESAATILTCLSTGAELMLKLTIGMSAVADGDPWP